MARPERKTITIRREIWIKLKALQVELEEWGHSNVIEILLNEHERNKHKD